MSDLLCGKCGGYLYKNRISGQHICPPLWTVTIPEYGFEREIYADSAQAAAEKAADRFDWDSADFIFAKGSDSDVVVTRLGEETKTFTIEAEQVVYYHASEKR